MQAIITLPPEVNIIDDDLMAKLKAMTANVSYPVLTVCCKRSPSHRASAQTPPGFGSVHLQLCQKPVQDTTRHRFVGTIIKLEEFELLVNFT